MKVNKTQAILFMYNLLIKEGELRKESVLSECDLSDLTFRRYIQEIRAFLFNFGINAELIYDRKRMVFRLSQNTSV